MPRPTLVVSAALAIPLLVAGCTGAPVSVASNTYPSVPNGFAERINLFSAEPVAVWVHGATILAVVTVGSPDCPPVPTAISSSDATTIDVTFVKSPNSPCASGASPTTYEFKIPEGVDSSADVTANLHFTFSPPVDYSVAVER